MRYYRNLYSKLAVAYLPIWDPGLDIISFIWGSKIHCVEEYCWPITSLHAFKNQAGQFTINANTALDYEQYLELLISAATTHKDKFKRDIKFGSKSRKSVYELEHFPNDGDEGSFEIDSYGDTL